jgi:phospholipid transport system substrate-binding protein
VRLDDGTKVPVNYGVVKRDSGWMMFDVSIEGISYVRNFRTELNAEIQAKGLRAVIDRLNEKRKTASASE